MNNPISTFLEMVTYRRPHQSAGERAFIDRFIMPHNPAEDEFGNLHITVGITPKTLFSTHTDTVHKNDAMQVVVYDENLGFVYKADGEPLGADNAAGVWLLLEMVDAGVKGHYVFHRGEERGGLGSGWLQTECEDWFTDCGFDRAIAFDRKGETSVITFQGGDRCCSDEFGSALAAALAAEGLPYVLDTGGVFTDTANYTELIPECTNVSVGYYDEHTAKELQSTEHLIELRAACLKIDWDALPTKRNPVTCRDMLWRAPKKYEARVGTWATGAGKAMPQDIADMFGCETGSREDLDDFYDEEQQALEDEDWGAYVTADEQLDIATFCREKPEMAAGLLAYFVDEGYITPSEVGIHRTACVY